MSLILNPDRAAKLCTCRVYSATWLGTSPRQTTSIPAAVAQAARGGEQARKGLSTASIPGGVPYRFAAQCVYQAVNDLVSPAGVKNRYCADFS